VSLRVVSLRVHALEHGQRVLVHCSSIGVPVLHVCLCTVVAQWFPYAACVIVVQSLCYKAPVLGHLPSTTREP